MGLHVTECAEVKQKTNKHTPEVLIPSDRFLCHYRKVDSQNEELIWKERYFHICESMMYNVLFIIHLLLSIQMGLLSFIRTTISYQTGTCVETLWHELEFNFFLPPKLPIWYIRL